MATAVPEPADELSAFADRCSPDVCLVLDAKGVIRHVGASADRIAGWTPDDLLGRSGLELIHPDDLEYALGMLLEAGANPGDHHGIELRILRKNGTWATSEVRNYNPPDDPEQRLVIAISDVTGRIDLPERRRALERLVLWIGAECAGASVDGLDGVIERIAGRIGNLLEADEVVLGSISPDRTEVATWGWSADPRTRPTLGFDLTVEGLDRAVLSVDNSARLRVELGPGPGGQLRAVVDQPVIEAQAAGLLSVFWHTPDARRYWDEGNASLLEAAAQILVRTARRVQRERALAYQALHDGLTGLANRGRLLGAIDHELSRTAGRRPVGLALAFCDLDHFKEVNDRYGHHIGDAVLVEVASRLNGVVRACDLVSRVGGDEFVVLCPDVDSVSTSRELADRMLAAVGEPMRIEGIDVAVSVSIGVATIHGPGRIGGVAPVTASELLRLADQAMYAAKSQPGRGVRLVEIDASPQPSAGDRSTPDRSTPDRSTMTAS